MAIIPSSSTEQEKLLAAEWLEGRAERAASSANQKITSLSREVALIATKVNDINRALEQKCDPAEIEQQIDDLEGALGAMKISKKSTTKSPEVEDDDSDDEDEGSSSKKKTGTKTADALILGGTAVGTVLFGYYAPGHPLYTILTMLAAGASKCLMSKLSVVQQISFHALSLPAGFLVSRYTPFQAMTVSSALALSAVNKSIRQVLLGKEVPAHEEFKGQVATVWQKTSQQAGPYVATSRQWAQSAREGVAGWVSGYMWGASRQTTLGGANNV